MFQAKKHPNIALIVLDTVRPDHLSCYGYPRPTSPNVDRLAAEGVRYEGAFCTAPWTLPSHGSMFTGAYVSRHGLDQGSERLSDDLLTLAEFLTAQGYQTAGFSSNIWVSEMTGLARGFEYFRRANVPPFEDVKQPALWQKIIKEIYWRYFFKRYDYGAREINHMIADFFRDQWQSDRPLFLFVNYLEAHLQYEPPRAFRHLFLENREQRRLAGSLDQDARKFNAGFLSYSEEELAVLKALYDAEIRYADFRLGKLVELLEAWGILDDTLLIITSDHGENLGDHGLMDHQFSLHDTLMRVPLVMRHPGLFEAGQVVGRPAQTVDFWPTVAELLGATHDLPADQVQGESLLSLPPDDSREVFAEYLSPRVNVLQRAFPGHDWSAFDRALRAIRTGRHKFIQASDGRDELYDIEADPGESHNLVAQQPDVVDDLRRRLEDWVATVQRPVAGREADMQADTRRVLEGLGYI